MTLYGNILHRETGRSIGWVQDGKLTARNGETYRVDGDKILSAEGNVLGYLSSLNGETKGNSDLAVQLAGRGD